MANLVPQIGAKGTYQLKEPFNTDVKPGVVYTCVAIRRLPDFVNQGRDPRKLFYEDQGLTETDWARDSADPESCIVTLTSPSGQYIYVPSYYIESFPNLGGIPYTVRLIGINLGAIPDYLDLGNLLENIENLVRDTIGIESTASSVAASDTKIVSYDQHESLEVARQDLIATTDTASSKAHQLEIQVQRQYEQIQALEDYIKNHLDDSDSDDDNP